VLFWLLSCALASWIGGWPALSSTYRTQTPFVGTKWTLQDAQMRWWMNYNNVLTSAVNTEGLYLATMVLFRFCHPSLLIPWSDIKVRRGKVWIFDYVILTLGHEMEIALRIRAGLGEKLRAAAGAAWPVEEI
jgi:hypothetical protein